MHQPWVSVRASEWDPGRDYLSSCSTINNYIVSARAYHCLILYHLKLDIDVPSSDLHSSVVHFATLHWMFFILIWETYSLLQTFPAPPYTSTIPFIGAHSPHTNSFTTMSRWQCIPILPCMTCSKQAPLPAHVLLHGVIVLTTLTSIPVLKVLLPTVEILSLDLSSLFRKAPIPVLHPASKVLR
jgi:hypothetical protein